MGLCSTCRSIILWGSTWLDGRRYCSIGCARGGNPQFCKKCHSASTDEEFTGSSNVNGIGTKLYGVTQQCGACGAATMTKWFVFVFLPLIPLASYRMFQLEGNSYIGRRTALDTSHVRNCYLVGLGLFLVILGIDFVSRHH